MNKFFKLSSTQKSSSTYNTMGNTTNCFLNEAASNLCFNDSASNNDDEIFYLDFEFDFYEYLETFLLLKSNTFDDEYLNINLFKVKRAMSDERRAFHIMSQLILYNDLELKDVIIKSLLCWQSQFQDLIFENIVLQLDTVDNIGNYFIKSKKINMLAYSLHSKSLDRIKLIIEKLGADINFTFANNTTIIHYSIELNSSKITSYLLDEFKKQNEAIFYQKLEGKSGNARTKTPLELAIHFRQTKMIFTLIKFYYQNVSSFNLSNKQIFDIFKCLSLNLDMKFDKPLIDLLIDKLQVNLLITYQNETLFLVLASKINRVDLFIKYFQCVMQQNTNKQLEVQKVLLEASLLKLKEKKLDVKLLEEMFQYIEDKQVFYKYLNGLIQLNETCLLKTDDVLHPFFTRLKLLVKYDFIPQGDARIQWLEMFINLWLLKCSHRSSTFYSSCSTQRYLSLNDLTKLTDDYLDYLIKFGLNEIKLDLVDLKCNQNSLLIKNEIKVKDKLIAKAKLSLTLMCRNKIRQMMRSLTISNMKSLNLPENLLNFLIDSQ